MAGKEAKILLVNPPARQQVFRDCYCSDITKGPFFIHPLDLQAQSGYFDKAGYEIDFIDGVVENAKFPDVLRRIRAFDPDVILSMIAEAVYENDREFVGEMIAGNPRAKCFLSGDIARYRARKVFDDLPEVEGVLMDFSSPALLDYLNGRSSAELATKGNDLEPKLKKGFYAHPPASRKFARKYNYRLPFFKKSRYYSLLTTYGCPFQCSYCNVHEVGYAKREIDSVIEEMKSAASMGYRSLYMRDPTFMLDKKHTFELFDAWRKENMSFEWIAYTRPDVVDEESICAAARMGCGALLFGVETFDEKSLKDMSRAMSYDKIVQAFRLAAKYGVDTAAFILIGMGQPPDDGVAGLDDYQKRLTAFLDLLDPAYISLNVFHERPGVNSDMPVLRAMDDRRQDLRILAARINGRFYLHPKRILRHLRRLFYPGQWGLLLKIAGRLILRRR